MVKNCRLAIDIGGTFTDGVLDANGRHYSLKLPTNPNEPEQGFMDIAKELAKAAGVRAEQLGHIIHGTTLATNAIIERKGSKTALITTRGFRDSLEIGYESRHDQYDLGLTKIDPLVPRVLRRTVPERCLWDGTLEQLLDETVLLEELAFLEDHNVDSIAIGFLHAYANPANEERAADIIRSRMPGIALSLSSRICPEIREFERFSTTVADAYVKPVMARYIGRLENLLKEAGFGCPLLLVTSAGGLTGPADARERPVQLVESGPSGGAMLAEMIARNSNEQKVLPMTWAGPRLRFA